MEGGDGSTSLTQPERRSGGPGLPRQVRQCALEACYRFRRLSGLEIVQQSGFEAGVQMWVHSHGKAGGFSVNEVADLLASEFRSSGRVDPGV